MNRTILVVPGHWPMQKLLKARKIPGVDLIMWDLEDGVPEEHRSAAVQNILALGVETSREVVRIDPVLPGADRASAFRPNRAFDAVAGRAPIVVPKWDMKSRGDFFAPHGWFPLVETPAGVQDIDMLRVVAHEPEKVRGVLFGCHDLAHSLGVEVDARAIEAAGARVALAARAAGWEAIAPPAFELDIQRLWIAADHWWDLGFTGMGVLHPRQIETVRRAFEQRGAPAPATLVALLAKELA